jgi:RNA polymerase sigma factor (sigma-70 family)
MRRLDEAACDRLYRRAGAERWGLPRAAFSAALGRSAARLGLDATPAADVEDRLSALRLGDLALACACAEGIEAAWEHFVLEYRPALYRAAAAIAPGGNARELADSIYAELFGLKEKEGERQSLFRYFHGQSSLATWLRAILAQRHVDGLRARRREAELPDEDSPGALASPTSEGRGFSPGVVEPAPASSPCAEMVESALAAAVGRLASRDRLRLAWYYGQNMTLAQIGRALGEHEATVSRHLSRARKSVRGDVERHLAADCGMSEREIEECLSSLIENAGTLDLEDILEPVDRKGSRVNRSTSEGMP